jgi:hypothetical protein
MKFGSVLPAIGLAAGILVATAVSLWSSRSLAWALAGPAVLSVTVLLAARSNRSSIPAAIMAGGLFLAGTIVALADRSSVPMMMPILGACAVAVLPPRRCVSYAGPA